MFNTYSSSLFHNSRKEKRYLRENIEHSYPNHLLGGSFYTYSQSGNGALVALEFRAWPLYCF